LKANELYNKNNKGNLFMGIIRVSNSGIFVVESGVVSARGTPPPAALPQPGNVQLRWDFSVNDDLWLTDKNGSNVTDGGLIALCGLKGTEFANQADLNSPTEANRPSWQENGINGLGSSSWEGTTQNLQRSIATNGIDDGNMTVFAVFAPPATTSNLYVFNYGTRNPSLQAENSSRINPNMTGSNNFGTVSAAYSANETLGVIMTDDGADAQEYRYSHDADIDLDTKTSAGPSNGTQLFVGTFSAGGFYEGLIGELIFWSPSLSASEMDDLQVWAFEKWGMVWA
jgi:hypothetical protein